MGPPRSSYYDGPPRKTDDAEIIATMRAICDEFETYGYRRIGGAAPSRTGRQFQKSQSSHAQAQPAAQASAAIRHHRQRPRRSYLSGSRARQDHRWTEPAVGGGYHLHRHRGRLRLFGRHPRARMIQKGAEIAKLRTP
jgi:hypothetical protein